MKSHLASVVWGQGRGRTNPGDNQIIDTLFFHWLKLAVGYL